MDPVEEQPMDLLESIGGPTTAIQHPVPSAGDLKRSSQAASIASSRHSLALITREGARAADLIQLRDHIRSRVLERFGVQLEQEPVQLGPSSPAAGAPATRSTL